MCYARVSQVSHAECPKCPKRSVPSVPRRNYATRSFDVTQQKTQTYTNKTYRITKIDCAAQPHMELKYASTTKYVTLLDGLWMRRWRTARNTICTWALINLHVYSKQFTVCTLTQDTHYTSHYTRQRMVLVVW